MREAEFVFEAVVDDMKVKQDLFESEYLLSCDILICHKPNVE